MISETELLADSVSSAKGVTTMRTEFELTDGQIEELLALSRPAPAIALHCGEPPSPQQMANDFWQQLGSEMGFDYMTARPAPGKGPKFFTAEVEEHTPDEGEPHAVVECESRGCVKLRKVS